MSARVLVLYASTHGHTTKIAERIGAALTERSLEATVRNVDEPGPIVDPTEFEGVIVGASVHASKHQPAVAEWVEQHHAALQHRPTAFFSVSLSAADDTDEARDDTQKMIDDFLTETHWAPTITASFAGALQFREYNLPTRVLMRLIARKHMEDVDLHGDTEFTDWDAVDAFAGQFAGSIHAVTPG